MICRWIKLLMALPPSDAYIALSSTVQATRGRKLPGQHQFDLSMSCDQYCVVSSAVGDYHQVLIQNQELWQYPTIRCGAVFGTPLTSNSRGMPYLALAFYLAVCDFWENLHGVAPIEIFSMNIVWKCLNCH